MGLMDAAKNPNSWFAKMLAGASNKAGAVAPTAPARAPNMQRAVRPAVPAGRVSYAPSAGARIPNRAPGLVPQRPPIERSPVLGSFKKGGTARTLGSYKLHRGERAAKRSGERGGKRC